jgi:hypothetical protein
MDGSADWVFYHALYHLLSHWAAFMATLGLLITIATVMSTSFLEPIDRLRRFCSVASVALTLFGSWFFLWRMFLYSSIVNRMLPNHYTRQLPGVSASQWILVIAAGITSAIAGLCIIILFRAPTKQRYDRVTRPTQP